MNSPSDSEVNLNKPREIIYRIAQIKGYLVYYFLGFGILPKRENNNTWFVFSYSSQQQNKTLVELYLERRLVMKVKMHNSVLFLIITALLFILSFIKQRALRG